MQSGRDYLASLVSPDSIEEMSPKVVEIIKEDEEKFRDFLYYHFSSFIKNYLSQNHDLLDLDDSDKLFDVLNSSEVMEVNKELKGTFGAVVPSLVLDRSSYWFLLLLALIPILVLMLLIIVYPEILLVLMEVFLFGAVFVAIFSLVVLVHFLKPELIRKKSIKGVNTYSDYVMRLVDLNLHFYRINNFRKLREEMNI